MATPGTKNLENLKFGQTYPKVPENRFLGHSDHSDQKSALVNRVVNTKSGFFSKGFWTYFSGAKNPKKKKIEKSKKSRFFRGAFWGHKTPKIPKIPKIPKTPPGWALNRFWVSPNQFWPILVPYETHFRKGRGGGSYYVNFWEISFLEVLSPGEKSNLRQHISYIWCLNGLKFNHWGNYTLFYGFWEVFKIFGYVSTETAPPKTAPNGPKREVQKQRPKSVILVISKFDRKMAVNRPKSVQISIFGLFW